MVERVRAIADEKACTPAQLALAWVLAQAPTSCRSPGTTKVSRLEENVGALDVHLTAEDLARLDEAAPAVATAGERYPDMSSVRR